MCTAITSMLCNSVNKLNKQTHLQLSLFEACSFQSVHYSGSFQVCINSNHLTRYNCLVCTAKEKEIDGREWKLKRKKRLQNWQK